MGCDMSETVRVTPGMPVQPARRTRAAAAALPCAAFPAAEAGTRPLTPRPAIDRLAWPVAAAAILAACAGLWLALGSLARLILA